MPRGPRGEERPADVIGCAMKVANLSVGIETEPLSQSSGRVRSGRAGGNARTEKLTAERRKKIARDAALARWR